MFTLNPETEVLPFVIENIPLSREFGELQMFVACCCFYADECDFFLISQLNHIYLLQCTLVIRNINVFT